MFSAVAVLGKDLEDTKHRSTRNALLALYLFPSPLYFKAVRATTKVPTGIYVVPAGSNKQA